MFGSPVFGNRLPISAHLAQGRPEKIVALSHCFFTIFFHFFFMECLNLYPINLSGARHSKIQPHFDLGAVYCICMHSVSKYITSNFLFSQVGIPVFVTGGIGGVHRNGQSTMDISADLTELGRTPVAVICAGVKSVLDIGRTLEYLVWLVSGIFSYFQNSDPNNANIFLPIYRKHKVSVWLP